MALYAGIDLHSTNNVVVVVDEKDKVVGRRRLANDLGTVVAWLEPYRVQLAGVVVESTYNWYWLVDGLAERGYTMHLANTVAMQQYDGLKYRDDQSDARWLAKLLRLGVLPEGHIYPREERAVRDLLRKRTQLVRQCTSNLLSIQNLFSRNRGRGISANQAKTLTPEAVDELFENSNVALAVKSNLKVMVCLQEQIAVVERVGSGEPGKVSGFEPRFPDWDALPHPHRLRGSVIGEEARLDRDEPQKLERNIAGLGKDMNGNGYASTASHKVTGTACASNHAPVGRQHDGQSIGHGRVPTVFWGSK